MKSEPISSSSLLPKRFDTALFPELHKQNDIAIWYCQFPDDEASQLRIAKQYPNLLPDALIAASAGRKAEFISGRLAAQSALKQLGIADAQVHSNSDRSPLWPADINGSITHKKTNAVAAASTQLDFVGIDLETLISEKSANKLSCRIIDNTEKQLLLNSNMPFADSFTRVFSAKEALYKAIYPDIQRYLGFSVCQVTAIEKDKLTLTLQSELQDELQYHRPFTVYCYPLKSQILSVVFDNR